MEGHSEGMVAIVQGLKDAGLAVTVTSKRYLQRRSSASDLKQLCNSYTSSKHVQARTCNAGAQVCDGRYTSSYQLAHCSVKPSSPPVQVSEFPQQKSEPNPTRGHFEIGASWDSQAPVKLSSTRRRSFRLSSPEKGLVSRESSWGTEAFVHSLRKYPSVPGRSLSSELVQRLITYTQDKNFSKATYLTKSIHSGKKNINIDNHAQKPQASKFVPHDASRDWKEKVVPIHDVTKERDLRKPSINNTKMEDNRFMRYKDNPLDDTYDYLNVLCSRRFDTEVRYLSDITRNLRDTLRQIQYQCDRPVACPSIQNRYNQHRKERHSNGVSKAPSNNVKNQGPRASAEMSTSSKFAVSTEKHRQSFISTLNKCCSCIKPMPCAGRTLSLQQRSLNSNIDIEPAEPAKSPSYDNRLKEILFNWLQELPVPAKDPKINKDVRENMANNLIEFAKKLQHDDFFYQNLQYEIAKFIDTIPMWHPSNNREDETFKENLVVRLVSDIRNLEKGRNELKTEIMKWVEGILRKYQDHKINKDDIAKELLNRIETVAANIPQDSLNDMEMIHREINDVLRKYSIECESDMSNIFKILINSLTKPSQNMPEKKTSLKIDPQTDNINCIITNWLKEFPQLENINKCNKSKIDKLTQRIEKLVFEDRNEEIHNEVSDWLSSMLEDEAKSIHQKDQNEMVKKLLDNLKINSLDTKDKQLNHSIWESIKFIPNLDKNVTIEMVGKLVENIKYLDPNRSEHDIKSEVVSWLTDLSKTARIRIPSKDVEKISRKVVSAMTPKRRKLWNKPNNLGQLINNEIADVFESMPLHVNLETKKRIQNKVSNIVSTRIDDLKNERGDIAEKIVALMETEGKISNEKAKELAYEILDKLQNLAFPFRYSLIKSPSDLQDLIRDEVKHILDTTDEEIDKKEEIERVLTELLTDQVMKGKNSAVVKDHLRNVLDNSNVSGKASERLVRRLAKVGNDISISLKTQEDLSGQNNDIYFSPSKRKIFEDSIVEEIFNFIESLAVNDGIKKMSRNKLLNPALDLANKTMEIIARPNLILPEKRENIKNETLRFLNDIGIKTNLPNQIQAGKFADIIQDLSLKALAAAKTSTPVNAYIDKRVSFEQDLPLSPINDYDLLYQSKTQPSTNTEDEKSFSNIVQKIENWLQTLSVDFDSEERKNFKDIMIKDLASDIIDRRKYLQLNPDAKISDQDELEHLKYQIFRWLNRLPDVNEHMLFLISKTNELIDALNENQIPVHEKGLDLLSYEIFKWFESIPSHLYKSTNKNFQLQMIKELVNNIYQLPNYPALSESVLGDLLNKWVPEIIIGSPELHIEGLKANLFSKGILKCPIDNNESNLVKHHNMNLNPRFGKDVIMDWSDRMPNEPRKSWIDIESNIEESGNGKEHKEELQGLLTKSTVTTKALKNVVTEWAQTLPLLPGKTIQDIDEPKHMIATKLEDVLKKVSINTTKENELKKILNKEIKDNLHLFPIKVNEVNERHINVLCDKLVDLLKQLDFVSAPNNNPTPKKAADVLFENIKTWCHSIPINSGTAPGEMEKAEFFKQNLASKLINAIGDLNMRPEIFGDDFLYEEILSDEVDELLSSLPLNSELQNNLPTLKADLMEKIKEAKLKTEDELAGDAYKQHLRDTISKTLPIIPDLSQEEQAPFKVLTDDLADAFINLHFNTESTELKHKYKQNLADKINTFCNDYLKRFPDSPIDSQKLNRDLYNALRKVPVPKNETIKSQVEQARIKDYINYCFKDLPLTGGPTEQLQKHKIVSILAKRLQELENEKELNPAIDLEDKMENEIQRWVKKLSISPKHKDRVANMIKQLTKSLKDTEETRRFNISDVQHTSDNSGIEVGEPSTRPQLTGYRQFVIPPSTLCCQDRECLEEIRNRLTLSQSQYNANQKKDAFVNPKPVDRGSQSDIGCIACSNTEALSQAPRLSRMPTSPQIIVKEYYWDSPADPSMVEPQRQISSDDIIAETSLAPAPEIPTNNTYSLSPTDQPCTRQPPFRSPTNGLQGNLSCSNGQTPSICPLNTGRLSPNKVSQLPNSLPCGQSSYFKSTGPKSSQVSSPPNEARSPLMVRETPLITPHVPHTISPCPRDASCFSRYDKMAKKTFNRPCFRSPCNSSASSPIETDVGTSRSYQSSEHKVTNLGSLDNVPSETIPRGSQSPRPMMSVCSPDYNWKIRIPQKPTCGTATPRRHVQRTPLQRGSRSPSRDRKMDKLKCSCQGRVFPQSLQQQQCRNRSPCFTTDSMKTCPRCCGATCPHPCSLFFR